MSKAVLLQTKKMLQLSTNGYDLLDKKAYILSKEIADLREKRNRLEQSIQTAMDEAKQSFKTANINMGLNNIAMVARGVDIDTSLSILKSSIMGVEVSIIKNKKETYIPVGIHNHESLYKSIENMQDIKDLIILLAMVQESIYKLTIALKKTETRVNALKNIVIPRQKARIHSITDRLEEQDRESYGRLMRII